MTLLNNIKTHLRFWKYIKENEELKKENKLLKEKDQDLEQRLQYSDLQIKGKDKTIRDLAQKGRLSQIFDKETTIATQAASVFHYHEIGKDFKAKLILDDMFSGREEIRFFKFEDEYRKEFFSVKRETQIKGAKLKEAWLFQNLKKKEKADVPRKVYDVITRERKSSPDLPDIPEIIQVYEYLLMKEVIGPDLFTFFNQLEDKPDTPAKRMLIEALLNKQIKDNAYIRTRDYDFDKNLIIRSSHGKKILAVYEEAKIPLKSDEKKKIVSLTQPLDSIANYPLRDGASWNFKIIQEQADYFLSDEFLFQKEPDYTWIKEKVEESVRAYDFNDMVRMTFQSDDGIHATQWPAPRLPYKERRRKEEYFVKKLGENGENIARYWELRTEEEFYRHARMWLFYRCNQENYPDSGDRFKQHHLEMAFSSLFMHTFGELPLKEELAGVNLEKILQLVMHPNCRPQAVEYPVKDAK